MKYETPVIKREVNTEQIRSEEVTSDLDEDEKERVLVVINEYKDLIVRNLRQIGCTDLAEIKISN